MTEPDWARLRNAEGPGTDTARHLRALVDGDGAAASDGFYHLWRAVLPAGESTEVAVPVLRILAELVHDPRFGRGDETFREGTLTFFRSAAPGHPELHEELLDSVRPFLTHASSRMRLFAAGAVGLLGRRHDTELIGALETMARSAERVSETASAVMSIGELGGNPREWLDDPYFCVRVCAAFAPALADDPVALDVLLELAANPVAFVHAFGLPEDSLCIPHFTSGRPPDIAETVCARTTDPVRLLPAVFAAIPAAAYRHLPAALNRYMRALGPSAVCRELAAELLDYPELWKRPSWRDTLTDLGLPSTAAEWEGIPVPHMPDDYSATHIVAYDAPTALRHRPGLFLGVGRRHPELPGRIVERLRTEFDFAVPGKAHITVDDGLSFTIDVFGDEPPEDLAFTARHPHQQLAVTAAFCELTTLEIRRGGLTYTRHFSAGRPLTPLMETGTTRHDDGYSVTFKLDAGWLPPGAKISRP